MSNSFRTIRSIAKKEIVEFVRDWRTLIAIILIPLLLFPVLFIALPLLLESEAAELDALQLDVEWQGVFDSELNTSLHEQRLDITFGAFPINMENLSDPSSDIERLRSGEVDAILRLKQTGDDTWNFSVIQLSTSEHSREARSRILTELYYWEQAVINRTLTDAGLDPEETLDPVRWEGDESAANAATSGEKAGLALSMFIPMVLAIWTATSAIQPAIDMTAGERERGTLEALLCLPCTRIELLAGKWLAVATITSVGVGLQISGLIFAITYLASATSLGVPTISLAAGLLLLFAVVIFAVMVVAFELAIAMKAHSVKEAGTLLGPAVLIIMFPALFTQIINLDGVESWWYAVPLVNILLAMRELLLDRIIVDHVAIWSISSALYAGFAAWYAARQFKREDLVASLS